MAELEVRCVASEYTLSVVPEGVDEYLFSLTVCRAYQMDGSVLWAVRYLDLCLNRRGVWDYEPIPSSRTDLWLRAHRFSFDEAMRLATKAAPEITANGRVAKEVASRG